MTQGRLARARSTAARVPRTRTLVATVLSVALALFAGGLWISSDDSVPYRGGPVSITTGVPEGVYHKYGDLLRPRLADDLDTDVTLIESQGSPDNLDKVLRGEATLGIATADAIASLQPAQRDQLRAVARLYDDYVHLVVKTDSGIEDLDDLRGKRVGIGPARSGVQLLTRRILATQGMTPEKDLVPEEAGIGLAAQMLQDGRLDAFFWSGGLPTEAVRNVVRTVKEQGTTGIRFVPLGDVAQDLQTQYLEQEQQGYREAVIPADAYPGVAEASTVAVPNLLVTRADADQELIKRVTGTVMGSRESIGAIVHAAQLVDPRTAIFTFPPLRLHEGARLWYRSAKP